MRVVATWGWCPRGHGAVAYRAGARTCLKVIVNHINSQLMCINNRLHKASLKKGPGMPWVKVWGGSWLVSGCFGNPLDSGPPGDNSADWG